MGEMAPDTSTVVKKIAEPLYGAKGWMKLLGVMSIIAGAFQALTIVGIIIAWLPIWLGVLLFQASGRIEEAFVNGREETLLMGLAKLKTYFMIMGILVLIGIILAIIGLIVGIAGGFAGMQQMQQMQNF